MYVTYVRTWYMNNIQEEFILSKINLNKWANIRAENVLEWRTSSQVFCDDGGDGRVF